MSNDSSYEVQVLQDGNWTIHEQYMGGQKDAAIDEAKTFLGQPSNIQAVRVVLEQYDDDSGIFNTTVIFKGANEQFVERTTPRRGVARGGGAGGKAPAKGTTLRAGAPRAKGRKKKKQTTLTGVLAKLLLVVLFSIALGGLLSVVATEVLGGTTVFGIRFVGTAESNLLIGVFIATFLISATALSITVLKGAKFDKSTKEKAPPWLVKVFAGFMAQQAGAQAAKKAAADEARRKALAAAKEAAAKAAAEEKPAEKEKPEEPAEEAPAETDEDAPLSPTAEKLKGYMMTFLAKALEGSQAELSKMDSFNKFGVSLFYAGACEILSSQGNMDSREHSKILRDGLEVMGFKKSHAGSFAERYEEYLMADSRYMQMFQAGRNAINTYMSDEGAGPTLMDSALTEWNKPKEKERQTGTVTVLFTDIAGSTAMTQTLGDAGAQQVVRAHNRIVREALTMHAGTEVKHTGDGIMASFNKTSDGVDAAIQMQRETAVHNQQNPDLPLHLKIGINAGEPIAEDNDLFGTTVQLSARIVDKAAADQIFISEIVQGLCAGKEYTFVSQGGFEMKGFDENVTLYEVIWADGAGDAQAFQPSTAAMAGAPAAPDAVTRETQPAAGAPAAPDAAPAAPPAQPAPPPAPDRSKDPTPSQ